MIEIKIPFKKPKEDFPLEESYETPKEERGVKMDKGLVSDIIQEVVKELKEEVVKELKEELKNELKETIKEEIKSEIMKEF